MTKWKRVTGICQQRLIQALVERRHFVFHVFASLAEFERNIIRERTNAGLKSARARGRVGGRPSKLSDEDKDMICQLMSDNNNSPIRIAKRFKVSKSTIYKTVRDKAVQNTATV